jgi:hypothetical protein
MDRKLITIAVLFLLYERLEYAWYLVADIEIYYKVPFVFDGAPIRLDSWVYAVSVKIENVITVIIIHLLLPLKKYTRWSILTFSLALIEIHLTYNEPFFKIPLPGDWYIPGSTATLRLTGVCYFMYGCVKQAMK